MLSGEVLAELVRPSITRNQLIATAWPSLSVEAKLQILNALQVGWRSTPPSEILLIAGHDPHPIVRYWAIRYSDMERHRNRSQPGESEMADLAAALRSDPHPFVRAATCEKSWIAHGPVEPLTHLERLLAIRNGRDTFAEQMVDWLEKLATAAVPPPEEELLDLVYEFTHSQWIDELLPAGTMDDDGASHYSKVRAGERLWRLAAKLPNGAMHQLIYNAPIVVERQNVLLNVFGDLPAVAQAVAVQRTDRAMKPVIDLIKSDPSKFDQSVMAAMKKASEDDEFPVWSEEEIAEARLRASPDKLGAVAETVHELKKDVGEIRELIQLAGQKKRGLFG